jgi:hypothetical protein
MRQVSYLQRQYRGARSTEHKIPRCVYAGYCSSGSVYNTDLVLRCRIKFNKFKGHKIVLNACFCPCIVQVYIALHFLTLIFLLFGFISYYF